MHSSACGMAILSCHTYPNDKLLQPISGGMQTKTGSCHTYPNDKLLQHYGEDLTTIKISGCHTYPNDKLLQLDFKAKDWYVSKLSYLPKR